VYYYCESLEPKKIFNFIIKNQLVDQESNLAERCFLCSSHSLGFYKAAVARLKETGHRITRAREQVLFVLGKASEPVMPIDLYHEVLKTALTSAGQSVSRTKSFLQDKESASVENKTSLEVSVTVAPIDRVTVYRILQTLEDIGIVHQTQNGAYFKCTVNSHHGEESSKPHTEIPATTSISVKTKSHGSHFHFVVHCEKCSSSSIVNAPETLIKDITLFLKQSNFLLTREIFETTGKCEKCQGN
jgi:Fe2+ or Zn2+ uptake regulation protein